MPEGTTELEKAIEKLFEESGEKMVGVRCEKCSKEKIKMRKMISMTDSKQERPFQKILSNIKH